MGGVTLQLTGTVEDRQTYVKARTIGNADADGIVPIEITAADSAVGSETNGVPDTVRLYDWIGRRGHIQSGCTTLDAIVWDV